MKNNEYLMNSSGKAAQKPAERSAAKPRGFVIRQIEKMFSGANSGHLSLRLPNNQTANIDGEQSGPEAEIYFKSWTGILRYLIGGELAFAEGFISGNIEVPSLNNLFKWYIANEGVLSERNNSGKIFQSANRFFHKVVNNNSKFGSRKNISFHYDLGNDFYKTWLDEGMTYSSADFSKTNDLGQAQDEKYANMANFAQVQPGDKLLEIGCGWGGFAAHIMERHQLDYTGVTISKEQFDYAKNRMSRWQTNKDLFHFQDYRDVRGEFDSIVSIEMFEAVGENHWTTYFATIKKLLKDNGSAAIQTITINDDRFSSYREGVDFIQKYIFPGGMLPSPEIFEKFAETAGLKVTKRHDLGDSYGETLRRWRSNFIENWPQLESQGFDQRFYRMWLYYFNYCEVGFNEKTINVYQFSLEHAGEKDHV